MKVIEPINILLFYYYNFWHGYSGNKKYDIILLNTFILAYHSQLFDSMVD